MTFEELFRDYWWLIFPIFGMGMAVFGMMQDERKSQSVMMLIKSYVDQGKEPPPELLKLALQNDDEGGHGRKSNSGAWTLVVFTALAAGFGVAWYMVQGQDYAFAFLLVTVVMTVLAIGALFILLLGRK